MKRTVLMMVSAVLSSLIAVGAESIDSISRIDAETLKVNLSGVDAERTLWLALDTADKGADVSAWSHWCRVSDLPAGSTLAYAKVPTVEAVTGCRYLRCFLVEKDALPGVETLASAAPVSAALDTGYTPGGRTKVEMDVKLGAKEQALFCSRGSDNLVRTYTLFMISDTSMRYDYGNRSEYSGAFPAPTTVAAQKRYTFVMGPEGLSTKDGSVSYVNPKQQEFTAPTHMFLFSAHNSGANFSARFTGVFYGLKAWPEANDATTLALDLVPARKGGTVGVFDRVGGGFIAPVSGSLTAGETGAAAGTACAVSSALDLANYVGIEAVDAAGRTLTVLAKDVSTAGDLWVAYGTSDAGDVVADWSHCSLVGKVASGASRQKVRLPPGWDRSCTHIRCFVLTSGALPGAATLASVTPNSATVNTKFRPTGRSRIETDCRFATTYGQGVFCARAADYANSYSLMHMNANQFRFDYGTSVQKYVSFLQTDRQTVITAPWGLAVVTNGVQTVYWKNEIPSQYEAGSDLFLFAAQAGGANPGSWFTGVFFGMKAWAEDLDAESLALDLVPAKRNETAGLFNRVTGEFLTPSTGSLTAGAEVIASASQISVSEAHVCEACTITILSQDNKAGKLALALTGVETDAELWIGMDTKDRRDAALTWQNYVKVGDIVQGTSAAEVTLPAGWGESYQKLRCLLYSKDSIPGGERLAWLSTSGACVRTGYTPTGKTAIEMKARYEDLAANYAMFCARGASASNPYALLIDPLENNTIRYDYCNNYASTKPVPPIRVNYTFLADARGVYVNGGSYAGNQYGEQTFTAGGELYFFAYHSSGSSFSGQAKCSFSGAKIWSDYKDPDSLVMDIVPYRKGGVVGLYDLKTKQPLQKSAEGVFTAGASRGDGVLAQSATVRYPKGFIIVIDGRASQPAPKTKLFMAGDSTLDEHKGEANPEGYASWGSALRPYLNDSVEIVNYARAGFTTSAFMLADPSRGNVVWWDRIKNEAQSGDWVVIQFGHNDEKYLTVEEYKANLKTMIADVKAKGATPVLVTSIVRLTFEGGVLVDNSYTPPLETFAEAMRAVATETDTQLAEMRELSRKAALEAGEAEALTWNVPNDKTHLAEKGANLYASLFYSYVKKSGLGFSSLFR